MRSILAVVAGTILLTVLMPVVCSADTIITWQDTYNYWPGWPSPTSWQNGTDTMGGPSIVGGTIVVSDAGYVSAITADFLNPPGWTTAKMFPADLFIDNAGDPEWDYVLSLYNGRSNADEDLKYVPTITPTNIPLGGINYLQEFLNVPLYAVNRDAEYLVTRADNSAGGGYWGYSDIRESHPFAYTNLTGQPLGYGEVIGGKRNQSPLTYVLPDGVIPYSEAFRFGFTQNCANDVIYTPVPEPSTLLLVGIGLGALGVAGFKKRK